MTNVEPKNLVIATYIVGPSPVYKLHSKVAYSENIQSGIR